MVRLGSRSGLYLLEHPQLFDLTPETDALYLLWELAREHGGIASCDWVSYLMKLEDGQAVICELLEDPAIASSFLLAPSGLKTRHEGDTKWSNFFAWTSWSSQDELREVLSTCAKLAPYEALQSRRSICAALGVDAGGTKSG